MGTTAVEPSADLPAGRRRRRQRQQRERRPLWRELPVLLTIAVVLALLVKTFLVQVFFIPSISMEQTLRVHDRVLVDKLSYRAGSPHRGQVVVFDIAGTLFATHAAETDDYTPCGRQSAFGATLHAVQRVVGVASCGQDDYIKRVVAVPGDTVEQLRGGPLLVDGRAVPDPSTNTDSGYPFCAATEKVVATGGRYDAGNSLCGPGAAPVTVPAGMYWVMGDNRDQSSDSRYNGFVPGDKIVGRAFVKIWPPDRWGGLG